MSLRSALQAAERAQRREVRAAKARQRELEKIAKEQTKASLQDQARFEVETFEAQVEALLSIHKDSGPNWNWSHVAAGLGIVSSDTLISHETMEIRETLLESLRSSRAEPSAVQGRIEAARQRDAEVQRNSVHATQVCSDEAKELRFLARRIIAGDTAAYSEALTEINPLAELSDLGSSVYFTFHDSQTAEVAVYVKSCDVIPSNQKLLTSSGKVATKPMPKMRFQDYTRTTCVAVLSASRVRYSRSFRSNCFC
jgi:hypothetical protein